MPKYLNGMVNYQEGPALETRSRPGGTALDSEQAASGVAELPQQQPEHGTTDDLIGYSDHERSA